MFNIKKINLFFYVFAGVQLFADLPEKFDSYEYPELAKFVTAYRCSQEIERLGVQANGLSFFLKDDQIDRIINAERMKKVFNKHDLDHLDVAQKCLFKDGDLLKVASLTVEKEHREEKLTLEEVRQIIKFVEESGFQDWGYGRNVRYNKKNKLTFIDTENLSFFLSALNNIEGPGWPSKTRSLLYLYHLEDQMTDEARVFFKKQIEEIMNSVKGARRDIPLSFNTKYDDETIDFEKVKKEHRALNLKLNHFIDDERLNNL